MSLDLLLGNEQLKAKLAPALAQDRLSHAYLITGPAGSGKKTLARLLAAAMECTAAAARPCCVCAQCRKALSGTHPDVITVDDATHKGVSVKLVREARSDLFIRPNEGRRKVYVFPRAADLNASGQNALLKVLEEPPAYGAFLLLAEDAQQLLETIQSRCVPLKLAPLDRGSCLPALQAAVPKATAQQLEAAYLRSGGCYGQALALLTRGEALDQRTSAFADAYARADRLALAELLVPLERQRREALSPLFGEWVALLAEALTAKSGVPASAPEAASLAAARSGAELLAAVRQLQRAQALLEANVSPGAVCGALLVQLK